VYYSIPDVSYQGLEFVSPYNDPDIIGGQGTIGPELLEQIKNAQIPSMSSRSISSDSSAQLDAVFVPVGGGGLISGIAGYIKAIHPSCMIVSSIVSRKGNTVVCPLFNE